MLFQWNIDQLMSQIAISLNLKKLWNHIIIFFKKSRTSFVCCPGRGKVGKVKGRSLTDFSAGVLPLNSDFTVI